VGTDGAPYRLQKVWVVTRRELVPERDYNVMERRKCERRDFEEKQLLEKGAWW